MLPGGELSSSVVRGDPLYPVKGRRDYWRDWELAGVALNDPSQGLSVKVWELGVAYTDGGWSAVVSADDVPPTTIFSRSGNVAEVALSFDQNMNPVVAFTENATSWLRWFDPLVPGYAELEIPGRNLRVTIDDRRQFNISNSDVILSYVRDGVLYYRQQRDRFEDEYELHEVGEDAWLEYMVTTNRNRVEWLLTTKNNEALRMIKLRYSADGGHNYSDWRNLDSGETGEFIKPLIARRLGIARHRIWEIVDTSPVAQDILAASLMAETE